MRDYIEKKMEKLNRQVSIERILYHHNQWRSMSKKQQKEYENTFILFLRKNKIFRDLLLLNSIFSNVQKNFSTLCPHHYCSETRQFVLLLLIKIEETEYLLNELKYGLSEIEKKRIHYTKKNLEKTKQLLLDFFEEEKTLFFLIFYKGKHTHHLSLDMIREIFEYIKY